MYRNLLGMSLLSFVAMYGLMYAMVAQWAHVYPNLNKGYMALLMTAPMVVFELVLMRKMYPNRRLNGLLIGGSVLAGLLSFVAIRQQAGIGDREFLRAMIPHHSAAILMCEETAASDPEILALCSRIVKAQEQEIAEMKALLNR